jgi:multisubunit Na+/H+ antiporter MnhE subunit
MYYARGIIGMTAVYLALTANLQLSNIITGVLVSGLIMLILRPQNRAIHWRRTPVALWAAVRYGFVLIYDLAISGVLVARLVLDPALPLRQGNIGIPTECSSETAQALSAHAITITPGEMVVEMEPLGVMYTHALDASGAQEKVARAQVMRDEMLGKIAPG